MKQRLIAVVIACLLLFGLAACVNGCAEEPAPVQPTPQPTEVPNSPEPFTDDIVIGDPQQGDPLATMPPQATVTPKPATQAPTQAPTATVAPTVTPTPKTTAKTTAKATAKPTAAPTPTATAGSDVTMPELGDDPTPTPTATSKPIELPAV